MSTTPPWLTGAPVTNLDTSHMVPNYDLHGFQHHSNPYKDKSHLTTCDIRHHRWHEPVPAIKTRAELQQARKRGRIPDQSYDFDGDGVVGQRDYLVGRLFDKDLDGRLTPGERRQAEQALDNGLMKKFVLGIDAQGDVMKAAPLQQRRGVILSGDDPAAGATGYPKHFNADKIPKHATHTALKLSRLGELRGAGTAIGERYIASNCAVPEPVPPNHHTHPRKCEISHIRERAEADHQLARTRAGLLPMNASVNPERECRAIGLGYDPAPPMATRSQLIETRKEGMRRECEELRTKCDDIQVPLSVRRTEKEAMEFEFRRGDDSSMTLTKLKDRRRRDKIEHDMQRFQYKQREYPRFSDHPDKPFWVNHDEIAENPGCAPMHPPIPRTMSEPHFKITEMAFGDDTHPSHQQIPDSAYQTAAGLPAPRNLTKARGEQNRAAIGSNTKKSFTAEMIERGAKRNMPRLFDAIPPAHTGPRDMEHLDISSSMAPIREAAMKKRAEDRKANAEAPKRSILWSEMSGGLQSGSIAHGTGSESGFMGSTDGMPSMTMERMSKASNMSQAPIRPVARVHLSTDATMRGTGMQVNLESQKEPRAFKSDMARSFSDTGVRCGGFHRLDFPSQPASRTLAPEKADKNRVKPQSREKQSRKDPGMSQESSVQPL